MAYSNQLVLSGIPIYFMSLVRVLSAVSKVFEKLMRYFLWEEIDEWKGSHLVRWEAGSKRLNLGRLAAQV